MTAPAAVVVRLAHCLHRTRVVTLAVISGALITAAALALVPVAGLTLCRARRLYTRVATLTARAVLRIWSIRLVVHQDEPFPVAQTVYVANHSSTIDLFVLVALGLPNTRFFLAGFLRRIVPMGFIAQLMGTFFTVPQHRPAERVRIFQQADRTLRRTGESVFLSPEGARITTGEIGHFNKGAFHLATSLRAPIVPLYFKIPPEIDPGCGVDARPGTVHVYVKPRIDTTGWRIDDLTSNVRDVRRAFIHWHHEHRGEIMFDPVSTHRSSLPPRHERWPRGAPSPASSRGTARGAAFAGRSMVELLRFRARVQPDDRAFAFLRDGEHECDTLSYAELDRRSRMVAAHLQHRVAPGARALLVYPPGLEFIAAFFGCLYAGVVAVPVFPPRWRDPDRNRARAIAVADDARPDVVLSTTETAGRWAQAAEDGTVPRLSSASCGRQAGDGAAEWVATDTLDEPDLQAWSDPGADRRTLAFLQYTSGSTATPRGVMVSHGNLLHNLSYAFRAAGNDRSSVSVSWLPVEHDMGLIDGVLQPVYSGCPAYLMSPAAFLQRPLRWLRAISRYRATRSGAPNFAYDLCVRRIAADERAVLDLWSWRDAYNGAEPIHRDTLERFAATFADCGFRSTAFRPCYGLAEATLLVTSGRYGDGAARRSTAAVAAAGESDVCCGRPDGGTSIIVVDPTSHRPCADGMVGEVWVQGPGVAAGYWNQPAHSARTFAARTAGGRGPFLRTGDLGVIGADGLRITGRLKDVLIVRGTKHYPQDLERTAEGLHDAVRPGCIAAFAVDRDPSGDRIALVAEVDPHTLAAPEAGHEALAAIRRGITDAHGVQVSAVTLVAPGGVEKTTSGKVRRFACRDALLAGTLPVLASWRQPAPFQVRALQAATPPVDVAGRVAQVLACP